MNTILVVLCSFVLLYLASVIALPHFFCDLVFWETLEYTIKAQTTWKQLSLQLQAKRVSSLWHVKTINITFWFQFLIFICKYSSYNPHKNRKSYWYFHFFAGLFKFLNFFIALLLLSYFFYSDSEIFKVATLYFRALE